MTAPDIIDPRMLSIFILPDGAVSLECTSLSPADNLDLFGDEGPCPPQPLDHLIEKCLAMMAAVPDEADTAALRAMAAALRNNLGKVETALTGVSG